MHLGPNYAVKGGVAGVVQKQSEFPDQRQCFLSPRVPWARSFDEYQLQGGTKPPKGPVLSTRAAREECSHCSFILVCLCVSRFCFQAQPWLYIQHFVLLNLNSLGIVCRNSLVLSHHGLLDVWFVLFFFFFFWIRNKIVLPFSVQLHRQGFTIFNCFLFLQGSKLKARRRTSRSPRLAAWKSSGWSIRESAIRRAAQIFPEIAGWGTCCWFLLFLCKLRAVRKLLTASLRG